jgi:hypothetical protein
MLNDSRMEPIDRPVDRPPCLIKPLITNDLITGHLTAVQGLTNNPPTLTPHPLQPE